MLLVSVQGQSCLRWTASPCMVRLPPSKQEQLTATFRHKTLAGKEAICFSGHLSLAVPHLSQRHPIPGYFHASGPRLYPSSARCRQRLANPEHATAAAHDSRDIRHSGDESRGQPLLDVPWPWKNSSIAMMASPYLSSAARPRQKFRLSH